MTSLRFYRTILNLVSSLSRNAVGLLLGLFATPMILKALGEEKFGAFRVLIDWVSQLGLLEFGLFSALLPIFVQASKENPQFTPRTVVKQAFRKYSWVIVFQSIGFLVLFLFLDTLIPVSSASKNDLASGALVLGTTLFLAYSQIYRGYLDSTQRGYIVSSAMTLQNIIYIVLAIFLALKGFGILGQAVAYAFSIALSFIILFTKSIGEIRGFQYREGAKAHFETELKTQRAANFATQICGRLSFLMDNIVVSAFLGAKSVTAFYLTQRLLQIAMQQLQQLGNSTWPALSELFHKGDMEKFRTRVIEVTEFIAFAAGVLLSTLAFVNPSFVALWTGSETFAGIFLSNVVVLNTGLFSLISFWLWCFSGVGKVSKALKTLYLQTAVNLAVSLPVCYFYGMEGPALGTLVSLSLVTVPGFTLLLNKEFGISKRQLTQCWVLPFLAPVLISMTVSFFMGHPKLNSWVALVLSTSIYSLIGLLTFPIVFIRPSSRAMIYQRLKATVGRKFS